MADASRDLESSERDDEAEDEVVDAGVEAGVEAHHRELPTGRDPGERHRAATPLELLYDLTVVVAFSAISTGAAHLIAEGRWAPALMGFGFAMFGVVWAWINFAWFMSSYDTDDWLVRISTFIQMLGVLVLALGIPDIYDSLAAGEPLDSRVVVLGYVIMRLGLLVLWLRAARADRAHGRTALMRAVILVIAQIGWVWFAFAETEGLATAIALIALFGFELLAPYLADRGTGGAPWHAEHIAERYSLLTIIALGECVVGTAASMKALIEASGWNLENILVGLAGVGVTAGCWWMYFTMPWGRLLHLRHRRAFAFGYGHGLVFAAVVGIGAGLDIAALAVESIASDGHGTLPELVVVAVTAAPIVAFIAVFYFLYYLFLPVFDWLHIGLWLATAAIVGIAIGAAALGAPLTWCLAMLLLTPWVNVIGFETIGHEHVSRDVRRIERETARAQAHRRDGGASAVTSDAPARSGEPPQPAR